MTIQNPDKIGIGTGDWLSNVLQPIVDINHTAFSWYYDWGLYSLPNLNPSATTASFVPMIWNASDVTLINIAVFKASGATTLLGFNEPDNSDQANVSVDQALNLWPALMTTGLRLGSPAPTQNDVLGDNSWLGQFMAGAKSQNLTVDFIAVHYYSADQSVDDFKNWLEAVYAQYNKPIWVTEWCLADWSDQGRFSATEQASFAQAGTTMMDSLPFVERQAWFAAYNGGDGWNLNSGVFDASGNLTPVGLAFRDLNTSAAGTTGVVDTTPPTCPSVIAATIGSGSDQFILQMSEDAWNGDAQFTIQVDGKQIGDTQTATAFHSAGQTQAFIVLGTFAGTHTATVTFLNDAYGGTSSTDRNLYVDGATFNGAIVSGASLTEYKPGPQSFGFNGPAPALASITATTIGSGSDQFILQMSEDAWNGDARFTIQVDGKQIGDTQTATAFHSAGQTQAFIVLGTFAGTHTATVTFLNDAYGGTSSTDRNLYVDGATFNGATVSGALLTEYSAGPQSFGFHLS